MLLKLLEITVGVNDEVVKDDDEPVVCLESEVPKSKRGFLFSLLVEVNGGLKANGSSFSLSLFISSVVAL